MCYTGLHIPHKYVQAEYRNTFSFNNFLRSTKVCLSLPQPGAMGRLDSSPIPKARAVSLRWLESYHLSE
jgi:hypothetical protein